jgi:hypothetical protein
VDIANCIHYDRGNLQFEIPCIMSSAKITRKQIWEHEQFDFFFFQNLSNLSFFLSLRSKVFRIKKIHDHSVYIWQHQDIIFEFF